MASVPRLGWRSVEYPEVAAWEVNQERKRKETNAERRRLRLARKVVALAVEALGEDERSRFEAETAIASKGELENWHRRVHYASTWLEVVGLVPLQGLAFVSQDCLLKHAINSSLNCWCVLLLFTPSKCEELDYNRVRFGARWVAEARSSLSGLIDELREYRRAVVTCRSERIALGLAAVITEKRLVARVYGPNPQGVPPPVGSSQT